MLDGSSLRSAWQRLTQGVASHLLPLMILAHATWMGAKTYLLTAGSPTFLPSGTSGSAHLIGIGVAATAVLVVSAVSLTAPRSLWSRFDAAVAAISLHPRRVALLLAVVVWSVGTAGALVVEIGPDEINFLSAVTVASYAGLDVFFEVYEQLLWLGDQHPPLSVLLGAGVFEVVGNRVVALRVVFLSFLFGAAFLTYLIGRDLYTAQTGLFAALLFLGLRHIFQIALWTGNDLLVTFWFLLVVYACLRLLKAPRLHLWVLLSVALGLGLLSKYTMGLVYPLLGGIAVWKLRGTDRWKMTGTVLGSFVVFGAWLLFAAQQGILDVQVNRILFLSGLEPTSQGGSMGGISTWRNVFRIQAITLDIPSSLGLYTFPLLLTGLGGLNGSDRDAHLIVGAWVLAVALPLVLLLPDARYFFPCYPALALICAHAAHVVPKKMSQIVILVLVFATANLGFYL